MENQTEHEGDKEGKEGQEHEKRSRPCLHPHPAADSPPAPARHRFPREQRLLRSGEFRLVKERGETFKGRYMVLGVLPREEPGWRAGIITTRRLGNAVKRNRVRRRFKELARLALPPMEEKGAWLVMVARRAAIDASWNDLRQELGKLLRRAALKPVATERRSAAAEEEASVARNAPESRATTEAEEEQG